MNIQRKNVKELISFGCWDDVGNSFQFIVVSNEIRINTSLQNLVFKINLKLKIEFIRKGGVFVEIRINNIQYKATHKNILQFRQHVTAKVTFLGIKDDYQIVNQIGQGGQSEGVYEVQGMFSKEIRAMKQYNKSQQSVKKIHKEIKITQKFQNKNVIKILEVYETESSIFIIMEKLNIFNSRHYNQQQKIQFIYDLLNIIEIMHSQEYMHRDIKLSNIMINSKNEIKLIDFGLATKCKLYHKQCGTPGHMAPEIFLTKDYNEKCDIYSLGILIYEMLTQKQFFIGQNKQEIKDKNKQGVFDTSKISQVSLEFQDILKEMLQIDPNSRITAQKAKLSSLFLKGQDKSLLTEATTYMDLNIESKLP